MGERHYSILFLCTGNSARSILAECAMNRLGKGRFTAYSAGSTPTGAVHPCALELLQKENYDVSQLRSKQWDEFAGDEAPELDFVVTVCDNAAGETCPVWPGHPMTAHWGLPDPAAVVAGEAETRRAFADTLRKLTHRIEAFCALELDQLDGPSLKQRLDEIGSEE